ncbi:hypothetical protein HO133_010466 [Letharia lupina]|uniref:Uncharacterized protein n=1 Tax=Letharia lupina TaxID=560253 RepID=A0A8H6CKJ5_9LECA|nr:uncharacterized protein HO133_010466 [Letharia lupina]KAF6225269.1 hypothetical protein HO133_010466 [Letharia lupina]
MPSRVHKDGRRDDEALREVLAVDAKNDGMRIYRITLVRTLPRLSDVTTNAS